MSYAQDQDFYPPHEKSPFVPPRVEPPASTLAIVSLVFGCLGWTVLPIFGSFAAIVTGHIALGEIRQSQGRLGGRSMAKAGLWLGYLHFALILLALMVVALFFLVMIAIH